MMKATYSIIKKDAKNAMKGHFGEVFLAALLLPIAFSMISNFFSTFFGFIHWSIPNIFAVFTNALSTYITLRMIIKISRHKHDKIFINFFGSKKGIISAILFALLSVVYASGYLVFFWDYFVFGWDFINIIPDNYSMVNPELIENFILDYGLKAPTLFSLVGSFIYTIMIIIISVRLSFTIYIIADSDFSLIDSVKRSWELTKGNWWRVFFFPLSFILWMFAILFSFGLAIIYVGPYMSISYGSFYNSLLQESGFGYDESSITKIEDPITDENALDDEDNMFDKKDPFDSYSE